MHEVLQQVNHENTVESLWEIHKSSLSLKSLIKSWFGVPTTRMSIFILFVSAGVLFEGAFSLWVS